MICLNCGSQCPDGANVRFCRTCGAALSNMGYSSEAPGSPLSSTSFGAQDPYASGGASFYPQPDNGAQYGPSAYPQPDNGAQYGPSAYSQQGSGAQYGSSFYTAPDASAQYGPSVYPQPGAGASYTGTLPGTASGETKSPAKKKKSKVVLAVIIPLLVLLAAGATAFVIIFDVSFADVFGAKSWFEPESGKKTVPLEMLSSAENTVFDAKSYNFVLTVGDEDIEGTVVWGFTLLDSTVVLHWENGYYTEAAPNGREEYVKYDNYVYLHDGKLYITDVDDYVAGVDMSGSAKSSIDYEEIRTKITDTLEEYDFDSALIAYARDNLYTKDNLEDLLFTVKFNHLNQGSFETLLNMALKAGMLAFSVGASIRYDDSGNAQSDPGEFIDALKSNSDKLPDFRKLIGLVTNFLATDQAMVAFDISSSGNAKNGSCTIEIDVPELACDFLEYLSDSEDFREMLRGIVDVAGEELTDKFAIVEEYLDDPDVIDDALDALYSMLSSVIREPLVIEYSTEKGYMTYLEVSVGRESLFSISFSNVNRVKFKKADYKFIEDLPGSGDVDDEAFYSSLDELMQELEDGFGRKEEEREVDETVPYYEVPTTDGLSYGRGNGASARGARRRRYPAAAKSAV